MKETIREKFSNAFKKRTGVVYQNWIQGWAITERQKKKRTTSVGIEISEGNEHKLIVDEVTFNSSNKGTIETPIDLTKDMNEKELTKYVEREWNRGKYQAGKK